MPEVSEDATAPRWGPGFLRFTAWQYRAEAALATLALVGAMFALLIEGAQLALALFWFVFPDLVFLPIALASRGERRWPRWGALAYNATHSFLVWLPAFAAGYVVLGPLGLPMLGWAAHLTLDRAAGFYLRAGPRDTLSARF